jgi:hypothetical protein
MTFDANFHRFRKSVEKFSSLCSRSAFGSAVLRLEICWRYLMASLTKGSRTLSGLGHSLLWPLLFLLFCGWVWPIKRWRRLSRGCFPRNILRPSLDFTQLCIWCTLLESWTTKSYTCGGLLVMLRLALLAWCSNWIRRTCSKHQCKFHVFFAGDRTCRHFRASSIMQNGSYDPRSYIVPLNSTSRHWLQWVLLPVSFLDPFFATKLDSRVKWTDDVVLHCLLEAMEDYGNTT